MTRPWFYLTLPKFSGNPKFIASEKLAIINEKLFFQMAIDTSTIFNIS